MRHICSVFFIFFASVFSLKSSAMNLPLSKSLPAPLKQDINNTTEKPMTELEFRDKYKILLPTAHYGVVKESTGKITIIKTIISASDGTNTSEIYDPSIEEPNFDDWDGSLLRNLNESNDGYSNNKKLKAPVPQYRYHPYNLPKKIWTFYTYNSANNNFEKTSGQYEFYSYNPRSNKFDKQ